MPPLPDNCDGNIHEMRNLAPDVGGVASARVFSTLSWRTAWPFQPHPQLDFHLILLACTYVRVLWRCVNSVLMTGQEGDLGLVLTLTAMKFTTPRDRWTRTRQNKSWPLTLRRQPAQKRAHRNRSMFVVRVFPTFCPRFRDLKLTPLTECIVYTWDYHSSISFWSGLRVQPILSDEVQTFKALIMVHKVLQEGHPVVRSDSLRS